jgi:long-subunit acyl-CoA synthetase (AMP-forming)
LINFECGKGPLAGFINTQNNIPGNSIWSPYHKLYIRIKEFGLEYGLFRSALCGLQNLSNGAKIALFTNSNIVENFIMEQAAYMYGQCFVPLPRLQSYDSAHIGLILRVTQSELVLATNLEALYLIENFKTLKSLKYIILIDEFTKIIRDAMEKTRIEIIHFREMENRGKQSLVYRNSDGLKSPCLCIFDKDVNGKIFGVEFTHRNIISVVAALTKVIHSNEFVTLTENDIYFSTMDWNSVYERSIQASLIYHGGRIAFSSLCIDSVLEEMRLIKPNIVTFTPEMSKKTYSEAMRKVESWNLMKRTLFRMGYSLRKTGYFGGSFWNDFFFGNLANIIGGSVHTIFTVEDSLHPKIVEFFEICFSARVVNMNGCVQMSGLTMTVFFG